MSENRKYLRFALGGLTACMITGGVFGYVQLRQNPELSRHVPAIGLPTPPEFVSMLDETRNYWTHKLDSAALFETFTSDKNSTLLMVSDLEELPEDRAAFERKIIEALGPNAKHPLTDKEETTPPPTTNSETPVIVEQTSDEEPESLPAIEILPPIASIPVREVAVNPEPETTRAPDPPSVIEQTAVEITEPVLAPPVVQVAAPPPRQQPEFVYAIEEQNIQVEGVLVPQKKTVISSSRDGRIKEIFVDHGDTFAAGDILLSYDCDDLNAEVSTLQAVEVLAKKKAEQAAELFKLDIISKLEQEELEVERQQAAAQNEVLRARMEACIIRASYDGRVTNRLANPQEYTRTDRVLMEVASRGAMEVEFIVPSKWLRYLNIGAPITITIAETEQTYPAIIHQIYGEVDPVSQSIQMSATLDNQKAVLLPGMSGLVEIDATAIRQEGIRGYLEPQRTAASGQWRRGIRGGGREDPNG